MRKSKFPNCSSREKDKKRKFMGDNFGDDEKEQFKKDDKKRKKEKCDNLSDKKKKINQLEKLI